MDIGKALKIEPRSAAAMLQTFLTAQQPVPAWRCLFPVRSEYR
jgi:hypothetical protein